MYKGLALDTDSDGRTLLYAANFRAGTVDVFDQTFQAVHAAGSFTDPNLPAGFAPFNIQNLNGLLYVTYALPDENGQDDVVAPGNGFVDVFNADGVLQQRLVSQGPLNSPWGLALAPAGFGEFSGALLVGNVGDGHIDAFAPGTGRFLGQLTDPSGRPITIDHLWGLEFGNGAGAGSPRTLFFTAGIDNERHGLFGKLQSADNPQDDSGDGPSAPLYAATPTAAGEDNYPLPPTGGPAPRGDIEVQPRALPPGFPLQGASAQLVPTLLAVSEGPGATAVPRAPSGPGVAPATPTGAGFTSVASGPGTGTSAVQLSGSAPAGERSDVQASRSGALELLLALRDQARLLEETAAISAPPRDRTTAEAVASTVANADPQSATEQKDTDTSENPSAPPSTEQADASVVFTGEDETAGAVTPGSPAEQAQPERVKTLKRVSSLSAVLLAGSAALIWGGRRATRRITLRVAPSPRPGHF
jgi:hypothetical protein